MSGEWLSQLDEATIARRLAAVDLVLGTSDHITGLVRQRFPQYAERCHTVYNGVDLDAFAVDDVVTDGGAVESARPRIVFVGRVSPEKGVHDLIEAMPRVLERFPDTTLELIGHVGALDRSFIVDVSDDPLVAGLARFYPRDYGETLAEMAAPLGDHVRFFGGLSHSDVVRHVASADVLVNPSYSESFGMSLVEAMACRTPVVATSVGGMREIVDDDVGRLVDPADPVALAVAIVELLATPDVRRRMGQAGRARVERTFSWDVVARRTLHFYTQVVARGREDRDARRSG
jgi:glycosyltransferase involved in cell wall biosynthesis